MITFGKYHKNNNKTLEPIEWDVLYKDNAKALLLSKYVIDARAWDKLPFDEYLARQFKLAETYNTTEHVPITWSSCSIRDWLNKDFYNLAFNSDERKNILLTENFTKDEKRLNRINMLDNSAVILGGPNSKDYVFLLSIDEILKYFPKGEMIPLAGPDTAFKMQNLTSQATPYATSKGLYFSDNNDTNSAMWWLRSPGGANGMAGTIIMGNILYYGGEKSDDVTVGVRPAIWVKSEALLSEEEKKEKLEKERRQREQEERLRKERQQREQEERKRLELQQRRRNMNLCQHCGGDFKGLFKKVCKSCGRQKDY